MKRTLLRAGFKSPLLTFVRYLGAISILVLFVPTSVALAVKMSPILSLRMLIRTQVGGLCLPSLLGPPSEGCIAFEPDVDASASFERSRRLIFAGAGDRFLHVRDADTGAPVADIPTEGRVITKTLFSRDGSSFYIGTDKGILYGFNAFSYKRIFSFQADGTINNDLKIEGENVIFTSGMATAFCLKKDSGKEVWRMDRPLKSKRLIQSSNSNILSFHGLQREKQGLLLAIPHPDGYISILDFAKGSLIRKIDLAGAGSRKVAFPDIVAPMFIVDGLLWTASYDLGIFSLDPENGQIRNRLPLKEVSQLAFDGEIVYAASGAELLAISKGGFVLWKNPFKELKTREAHYSSSFSGLIRTAKRVFLGSPSALLVRDGNIAMGTTKGPIGIFDARTGVLLSVAGNLGFGPKINYEEGLGILAVTRRGSIAILKFWPLLGEDSIANFQ
jgi:outer membrane protein assembly factor BamB